jgi:hypothetical protein
MAAINARLGIESIHQDNVLAVLLCTRTAKFVVLKVPGVLNVSLDLE